MTGTRRRTFDAPLDRWVPSSRRRRNVCRAEVVRSSVAAQVISLARSRSFTSCGDDRSRRDSSCERSNGGLSGV